MSSPSAIQVRVPQPPRRRTRAIAIAAIACLAAAPAAAQQSASIAFSVRNNSSVSIATSWAGIGISGSTPGGSTWTPLPWTYGSTPQPGNDRLEIRSGGAVYCAIAFYLSHAMATGYACAVAIPDPGGRCVATTSSSWNASQPCAFDIEVR